MLLQSIFTFFFFELIGLGEVECASRFIGYKSEEMSLLSWQASSAPGTCK